METGAENRQPHQPERVILILFGYKWEIELRDKKLYEAPEGGAKASPDDSWLRSL